MSKQDMIGLGILLMIFALALIYTGSLFQKGKLPMLFSGRASLRSANKDELIRIGNIVQNIGTIIGVIGSLLFLASYLIKS